MAHFAQINERNIVTNVVVVPDEQESRGHDFLSQDLGLGGTWLQTSYNNRIRGEYASIGGLYIKDADIFIQLPISEETIEKLINFNLTQEQIDDLIEQYNQGEQG